MDKSDSLKNFGEFFSVSTTKIEWKSRKRRAAAMSLDKAATDTTTTNTVETEEEDISEPTSATLVLSERRKAMFATLEPAKNVDSRRPRAELLLPPPDFDIADYPKGWLIGKKRKLVNVDVVESMRRIAIQEMNRKDQEIDGLNEQLEEDSRCLEHLQFQLLEERSKRADAERENAMLQEQIHMLMNMLQEDEHNPE